MSCCIRYTSNDDLLFIVTTNGFICSLSLSHNSTWSLHTETDNVGNNFSTSCKTHVCSSFSGMAIFSFHNRPGPKYQIYVSNIIGIPPYIPNVTIFFQFQLPKWSSRVSRRDPGPISRVLDATGLIFAQPRSGASPSVRPTWGVKLNEKSVWHFETCTGRWNLGTRKTIF